MKKNLFFLCIVLHLLGGDWALAEPYYVTRSDSGNDVGTMRWAINQANANSTVANQIIIGDGLIVSGTGEYFINANVAITGGANSAIDMGGNARAFFVAGGTVSFNNLTIRNAKAVGGDGGDGGGGGAGLGGAIFVMNGAGVPGSGVTLASHVTVNAVTFLGNVAQGGRGGDYAEDLWSSLLQISTSGAGGGGGMGGAGGNSGKSDQRALPAPGLGGGGGGGGIASGGNGEANGTGSGGRGMPNDSVAPRLLSVNGQSGVLGNSAGAGGTAGSTAVPPGSGGVQGGGGGGGSQNTVAHLNNHYNVNASGGGGGGVGGATAVGTSENSSTANGGNGGFGGGGGGSGMLKTTGSSRSVEGGNGGFGGGGGGAARSDDVSFDSHGGSGGFGGGAGVGWAKSYHSLGTAGFGGGSAGVSSDGKYGAGGGGLGAGGAIFAMPGTTLIVSNSNFGTSTTSDINSAVGGLLNLADPNKALGATPGEFMGSDLFLGADTTVAVDSGTSKIHGSISGYGAGGNFPTLTKSGNGTLELHGANSLQNFYLYGGAIAVGGNNSLGGVSATLHTNAFAGLPTTLKTVSEAPGASPVQLAVGTLELNGSGLTINVGGTLSPDLVLTGAINGASSSNNFLLAKDGAGKLTLQNSGNGGNFSGILQVDNGTLVLNSGSGFNLYELYVLSPSKMYVSALTLNSGAMIGGGQIFLQNGAGLKTGNATGWGGTVFVEDSSTLNFTGGGGRIDVANGVSGNFVGNGFNGTISGNGSLSLVGGNYTITKDPADFSGVLQVKSAAVALPHGFTGNGKIFGTRTDPTQPYGSLTLGDSVGSNLSGTFSSITVDAPMQATDVTVGTPAGDSATVSHFEVANGRFHVPNLSSLSYSSLNASASGAKSGTAVFSTSSSSSIGGNGTLEVDPGAGNTVALSGLSQNGSVFSGTLHTKSGTLQLDHGTGNATLAQIDSGSTLALGTSSSAARFTGSGNFTAPSSGTISFSAPDAFTNFTGSINLANSYTYFAGGLQTSATVSILAAGISLQGDLNAPLHGSAVYLNYFSDAQPPPANTTVHIAANSFAEVSTYNVNMFYARFVVDGNLTGGVKLYEGAILETNGNINNLGIVNSLPGQGTVRFTGTGDRTLGSADTSNFWFFSLDVGTTHLTLASTSMIQSLPDVQMGANSELHLPHGAWLQGNSLTASGVASVYGDFTNHGRVNGPTGLTDYLVFEGMVTGTGITSGNIKYNGGHNPGEEAPGGLPGAPGAPNYHVTVIDGNLWLGANNVLTLDVGGYVRGDSYDGLDVTGTLILDGTLEILFAPGFEPDQNFGYQLLEAGHLQGNFTSFVLPALNGGYFWDTSSIGSNGMLYVIPEPSSVMLLIFTAFGAFLWCRRRRGPGLIAR